MNRILSINKNEDLKRELFKIGVSSQGVIAMFKKGRTLAIKLKDIKIGAANIIKQDMLSIGGDAAVARGVVNGKVDRSDVIIFGNEKKINLLLHKLSNQDIFDIPQLITEIRNLVFFRNNPPQEINAMGKKIKFDKTKIMGILNVTPDSFYDGGKYDQLEQAKSRIEKMVINGADIIDVGGESTRPFADKISLQEELDRVLPVIELASKNCDLPISIDTYKSEVAREAIAAGASIINDISGLGFDEKMADLVASYRNVPVIIMHIQGTPQNMQKEPKYDDVIEDLYFYFQNTIDRAKKAGIKDNNIIIDPGIGFGKTLEHNVEIIQKIGEFKSLGKPILLGCSNKSYLGKMLGADKSNRLFGTMATNSYAIMQGVQIIRVHEIAEHRDLIDTLDYIGRN